MCSESYLYHVCAIIIVVFYDIAAPFTVGRSIPVLAPAKAKVPSLDTQSLSFGSGALINPSSALDYHGHVGVFSEPYSDTSSLPIPQTSSKSQLLTLNPSRIAISPALATTGTPTPQDIRRVSNSFSAVGSQAQSVETRVVENGSSSSHAISRQLMWLRDSLNDDAAVLQVWKLWPHCSKDFVYSRSHILIPDY